MDSNIIKFRLTPELLELLESAKDGDESLHQTAKRILESSLKDSTQSGHTEQEVVHREQEDGTQSGHSNTDNQIEERLKEIKADLYSELTDQLNGLIEVRLGESVA
jgi:hypothetical protein